MNIRLHFWRLWLTIMWASTTLIAQIDRATLTGVIVDSSAAVVPRASLELRSAETGLVRSATTDANGGYRFAGLPVGGYELTVRHAGFKEVRVQNLRLQVAQTRTLDVTLEPAQEATTVDVQADATDIDQSSSQQGVVVSSAQLTEIPVNGREWSSYMLLAPGAVDSGGGGQRAVRFMGRSKEDNNYLFDGVDATGVFFLPHYTALRTVISNDAIAEFRVNAGLFTAENGNSIGGVVTLVSRSGSNQFHGGAFEYLRNSALDARRFIDRVKPDFRLNQFGANFGGPVVRNRAFFFANFEGLRQSAGRTLVGFVPSAAYRQRVIDASPVLRPLVEAYPMGAAPTTTPDVEQYSAVARTVQNENSGMFRIDYHLNDQTTSYVRYNVSDGIIRTPQTIFLNHNDAQLSVHNAVWQLQRIFSPTLVNEFKLGFNRSANNLVTAGAAPETISIPGFSQIPGQSAQLWTGNSYSLIDSLSWVKGSHTLKAGFEMQFARFANGTRETYNLVYASRDAFMANRIDTAVYGAEFANHDSRTENYYAYLLDEWKVKPNLTLNLGLRYEYYAPVYERHNRIRVYDRFRCGGICPPGAENYFPDFNNFGPRVSFAWSPRAFAGKTTIRGGFGIYHQQGEREDLMAGIFSDTRRVTLTSRDVPTIAYPARDMLASRPGLPDTPRAIGRDRKDFESYQAGLFVAQQLPSSFVAQVGYLSNLGRHVVERTIDNVINPATGTRPLPSFSQVDYKPSGGTANFHGLQASLQRSFRSGFLLGANYQWSHAIDVGAAGSNEASYPQNVACRSCEKASGNFDVRQVFTVNWVYELPFGRGKRRFTAGAPAAILGGWELGGIYTARTGLPVNVLVTRSVADVPDGNASLLGLVVFQRPDYVPGAALQPEAPTADRWINLNAFRAPAPGTFGKVGRNILRAPGLQQMDLALSKRWRVSEAATVAFRAEAFNLFNRAQLGIPNTNISSASDFGRITAPLNTGFTGSGTARQLQFMLRVSF